MDQFDGKVMQVTSVSLCPPWAALNNKAYDFDFSWLLLVEDPRGQPASKQYREPTKADLASGLICCEFRDHDTEDWIKGRLLKINDAPGFCLRFQCHAGGAAKNWNQCRIEVAE